MLDLSENYTTPNFQTLTTTDRDYILKWMFKYAGNADPATVIPGGDFRNSSDSHIDEQKVSDFESTPTHYKLFNRLQIKYRADASGFIGSPDVLKASTGIGTTTSPLGGLPGGYLSTVPGQAAALNGPPAVVSPTASPQTRISLINDGSPDAAGIRALNTLNGKDLAAGVTPIFWENIGSQIRFTFDGGPAPSVIVQLYPTYHEYRNGKHVNTFVQAPTPADNFVQTPHPFGTVPCLGSGGITPGGRCGYATSPADASARIPNYTVP